MLYGSTLLLNSNDVAELKSQHLKTLTFPLDAYWEAALIGFADHYELKIGGVRAGYFCLNSENQLVAFYLVEAFWDHGDAALAYVVKEYGVPAGLPATNDPLFLSHCLDITVKSQIHTYLFQDFKPVVHPLSTNEQLTFAPATKADLPEIFEHYRLSSGDLDSESSETAIEDMKGFIRAVFEEHHIFILRQAGKLVATSELRISATQKPYADLGMIVSKRHRRQGFGSYILTLTKAYCYDRDLLPICSCEATNIGSKKAIVKAGFVSKHRVILTRFATVP